ncbi:hypothetical protein DL769_000434 [Monosporascus sp. CRB-8-3]|nr:hypothetical protein DL769_000434 [Monosporascus sp. CRB-8-3]
MAQKDSPPLEDGVKKWADAPKTNPLDRSCAVAVQDLWNMRLHHAERALSGGTNCRSLLGYPNPSILAWDHYFDQGHQLGSGSYMTKMSGKPVDKQVGFRLVWDCPTKVPDVLPDDILCWRLPTGLLHGRSSSDEPSPWVTRPLYTRLCLSQIPVFRHVNGPKEHRENDWPMVWYQPKELLRQSSEETRQERKADPILLIAGGAWTDKSELLKWEQLCPSDYDKELFRDVEEPNT